MHMCVIGQQPAVQLSLTLSLAPTMPPHAMSVIDASVLLSWD